MKLALPTGIMLPQRSSAYSAAGSASLALRKSSGSLADPANSATKNQIFSISSPPAHASPQLNGAARKVRKHSALCDVDDKVYLDVLTNDIMHVQARLKENDNGGQAWATAGGGYSEAELMGFRSLPSNQLKVLLHEILSDCLMHVERATLETTVRRVDPSHLKLAARAPAPPAAVARRESARAPRVRTPGARG